MKQNSFWMLTIACMMLIGLSTLASPVLGTKPDAPISINLTLSEEPLLGKEVDVIFSVQPYVNAPNTTIKINLSEGFQYLSGDLIWTGNLTKNEIKTIKSKIKATKTGKWKIGAWSYSVANDGSFGKGDILYILITDSQAIVSKDQKIFDNPSNNLYAGISKNRIIIGVVIIILGVFFIRYFKKLK